MPNLAIHKIQTVWVVSLLVLLAVSKLLTIYHLPLSAIQHPIHVSYLDVDRLLVLLIFISTVLFMPQASPQQNRNFWLIILNIALLTMLALGLEKIQFGLGVAVFLLMMSTAVVEEILLRYVVFELFWQRVKPSYLVVGSSVFFTLVHGKVYDDIQYGILVLLTGLLLGGVYAYFRGQRQIILGIIVVSWLHLGVIVLGFYFDLIPQ